jgi:hypothetical protein
MCGPGRHHPAEIGIIHVHDASAAVWAVPEPAAVRHVHAQGRAADVVPSAPGPPPQLGCGSVAEPIQGRPADPEVQREQFLALNDAVHPERRALMPQRGCVRDRLLHPALPGPVRLDLDHPVSGDHVCPAEGDGLLDDGAQLPPKIISMSIMRSFPHGEQPPVCGRSPAADRTGRDRWLAGRCLASSQPPPGSGRTSRPRRGPGDAPSGKPGRLPSSWLPPGLPSADLLVTTSSSREALTSLAAFRLSAEGHDSPEQPIRGR